MGTPVNSRARIAGMLYHGLVKDRLPLICKRSISKGGMFAPIVRTGLVAPESQNPYIALDVTCKINTRIDGFLTPKIAEELQVSSDNSREMLEVLIKSLAVDLNYLDQVIAFSTFHYEWKGSATPSTVLVYPVNVAVDPRPFESSDKFLYGAMDAMRGIYALNKPAVLPKVTMNLSTEDIKRYPNRGIRISSICGSIGQYTQFEHSVITDVKDRINGIMSEHQVSLRADNPSMWQMIIEPRQGQ